MTAGTILLAGGGTGGHVFPVLAVADALQAQAPRVRPVFVGTERGLESKVVAERGYELLFVQVAPIRGGGLWGVVRGVARAAAAIPAARALVRRLSPGAVFSIGGYAAGPVSLAARSLGVPVALMEPNAVIGLSNRLIAPLVQRAYTAFSEPERYFRSAAVLRAGVPIRTGFEPRAYTRPAGPLQVLVLGGSQGAKALNEAVPEALAGVRTAVRVVHQCGRGHAEAVTERYRSLGASEWATVVSFIDEMPDALGMAQLVISRSGASAVSEICAVARPSILVPYPYAAGDHQLKNAESLQREGASVCVPSSEARPARIAEEIERLTLSEGKLEQMATRARSLGRPHAAATIARDLLSLAGFAAQQQDTELAAGSSSSPAPPERACLQEAQ